MTEEELIKRAETLELERMAKFELRWAARYEFLRDAHQATGEKLQAEISKLSDTRS